MANDPQKTRDPAIVPNDERPHDLSQEEWAAIQEARADLAAGRHYTQEEIEAWIRERQAARHRHND
ncbi:hypothetical protein [Rhodovibrio salinarum]|uniref:Uncharacterized protein n=1 Tax=Rhodovibrio salinarum TaxID=1087 RepID=A0A934QHD3_9PROT|nr:hypothetical protein [Rhodovibrio salinarum]MBK1697026.1 hypothetical protein [Rhodovibrio salinarum]